MIAFAPLAGFLLGEACLRFLLFSSSPLAQRHGRGFRQAGLYAPEPMSDEFQELRYLFSPPDPRRAGFTPHPELGWISKELDPVTLAHPDEASLDGRRPVLLFGSSYAACWFPVKTCFEDRLERSELAGTFRLLNFGVPAYGLDQAVLLLTRCLPRFAGLRPVVVLTAVVENDLARGQLSFFMAPKPRFVERAGQYELSLPDELDPRAYIARHPPRITSYLVRYLLRGFEPAPGGDAQRDRERLALARHCLARAHAELEALGLEHFVVLFHSPLSFPPLGGPHPDEQPLLDFLRQSGIAYVDTRAILEEEVRRSGAPVASLYLHGPANVWHPTERGTEVLFEAFRRGLTGRTDVR